MQIKVRSVNGQTFGFDVTSWEVTDSGIQLNLMTEKGRKIVWLNRSMVSSVEEE